MNGFYQYWGSMLMLGNQWEEPQHNFRLPWLTCFSKDATTLCLFFEHGDIHTDMKWAGIQLEPYFVTALMLPAGAEPP